MHESAPVDQLKTGMDGNAACTQCHKESLYTRDVARHTFHKADSPGSECMNCHMPYITYALLGAIRSHQIASPESTGSARHGLPNACNLCHLDKTLAWTQEQLVQRYSQPPLLLSEEQQTISAALLWLLRGNAAQRVITAWHVGWAPARQASGADWLAPFQARLLADPYGVVRYVAQDNLRKLPGFHDFKYDFLAPEPERLWSAAQAIACWQAQKSPRTRSGAEILIDADGQPMEARIQSLLSHRDNRPVTIKE